MAQALGDMNPRNLDEIPKPTPGQEKRQPPNSGIPEGLVGPQGNIGYQGALDSIDTAPWPPPGWVAQNDVQKARARMVNVGTLLEFSQKVNDVDFYDFDRAVLLTRDRINSKPKIRDPQPFAYYDTENIGAEGAEVAVGGIRQVTTEQMFFVSPLGQAGKTELETNVFQGGVISFNPYTFFSGVSILRFFGDTIMSPIGGAVRTVLESGVFQIRSDSDTILTIPMSSFSPINPLAQRPRNFFYVGPLIAYEPNCVSVIRMMFPRGVSVKPKIRVRLELVGMRGYCF